MMKLVVDSNKEQMYMHMQIIRVGFERLTSKNGLYHFLLVVLPRISP